jgi:hypothetical protein
MRSPYLIPGLIIAALEIIVLCIPVQDAHAAGKPLAIAVTCPSVVEGAVASCTFSTSGGNGRLVTVTWSAKSNTATAGEDFPALLSGTAQVSNKSPFVLRFPTLEDSKVEGDEYAAVRGTVTSGSVHPAATAALKIIDNDVGVPPPPATQTCPDGSVILATDVCPAPPPPPPPAGELAIGGHAQALTACASAMSPTDVLAVGSVYSVVGFAHLHPIGQPDFTSTVRDVVVLNDATHFGDGWRGIFVPTFCVSPAP